MTRAIRLRPWQKAAFDAFSASESPDFLAVATPGAGKTTFALTAARFELGRRPGRLVVVAPTAHLKVQWAAAAHRMALHLDPSWSPASGRLAPDLHGVVTTYQQVASSAELLRGLADDAFVILDEIHHAADDRAWGDSIRIAFGNARRRGPEAQDRRCGLYDQRQPHQRRGHPRRPRRRARRLSYPSRRLICCRWPQTA